MSGKLGECVQEYVFHPTRKFRMDFYLPQHRIAVEYQGIMHRTVGHNSLGGIMRDAEKLNLATEMGIRVFLAHAENIRTKSFFELMERVVPQGESSVAT